MKAWPIALAAALATLLLLAGQRPQLQALRVVEPALPLSGLVVREDGVVVLTWGSLLRRWTFLLPVTDTCGAPCERGRAVVAGIGTRPGLPDNVRARVFVAGADLEPVLVPDGSVYLADPLGRLRAVFAPPHDAAGLTAAFLPLYAKYRDECCVDEGGVSRTLLGR